MCGAKGSGNPRSKYPQATTHTIGVIHDLTIMPWFVGGHASILLQAL